MSKGKSTRLAVVAALLGSASLVLGACAGAGGGGGGGTGSGGAADTSAPIRVLMVGNPQMTDIAR